jgi:hypothetical protein
LEFAQAAVCIPEQSSGKIAPAVEEIARDPFVAFKSMVSELQPWLQA